jgi:hypothetical protein
MDEGMEASGPTYEEDNPYNPISYAQNNTRRGGH